MTSVAVSMACLPGLHTADLLDGSLQIEGIDYTARRMGTANEVTKAMMGGQYDVGEMSLATYVKVREQGLPVIGVPVFTSRKFLQPYLFVASGFDAARLGEPGLRVGVAQYWMTASIWQRWLLAQQHGVDLTAVEWVPTSPDRVADAPIPDGYRVAVDGMGASAEELFATGRVEVFLSGRKEKGSGFRPLYDDPLEACAAFHAEHHFIPVMHVLVLRTDREVHDPEIATKIVDLWTRARANAFDAATKDTLLVFPFAPSMLADTRRRLGPTWNEYGLTEENTAAMNVFLDAAVGQGLITGRPDAAEALWEPSANSPVAVGEG